MYCGNFYDWELGLPKWTANLFYYNKTRELKGKMTYLYTLTLQKVLIDVLTLLTELTQSLRSPPTIF